METLAARVRTIREMKGLTQAELGERARMARTDIVKLEGGNLQLGPARLTRVADALEVSVLELQPEAPPDQRGLHLLDLLEGVAKNDAALLANQREGLLAQQQILDELRALREALALPAAAARSGPKPTRRRAQ